MRNVPFEGCGCDCGSPLEISGVIRNGRRYDDGNVSAETYNQGMQAMQIRINNVGEVAAQANSKAAEAENNVNKLASDTEKKMNTLADDLRKETGRLATTLEAIAEKHTKDIEVLNTDVNALSDANNKLNKQISETAADFEDTTNKLSERIAVLEAGGGGGDSLIVINEFSATPKTAELGARVNIVLSWNLSRPAASAKINGINVSGQQYTDINVAASREYKLVVADEKGREVKATSNVTFLNHIYWGVSAESNITETLVETLGDHVLSDSKARSITVDPIQQYIYYAYPKRLGAASFRQSGIYDGGFEDPATIRVINGSGYAEDYYVYRSTNILSAKINLDIR